MFLIVRKTKSEQKDKDYSGWDAPAGKVARKYFSTPAGKVARKYFSKEHGLCGSQQTVENSIRDDF